MGENKGQFPPSFNIILLSKIQIIICKNLKQNIINVPDKSLV